MSRGGIPMEDDESEWEYEYHDTETEDVYITLDFAADQEPGQAQRKPTTIFEANKKRISKQQSGRSVTPEAQQSAGEQATPANAATGQDHVDGDETSIADEPAGIQILELHGDNPIISYNETIYSCHWAHALGTDLFFARRPVVGEGGDEYQPLNSTHAPLRALKHNNLLALGAARLIAMPADLHVRPMHASLPLNDQPRIAMSEDADFSMERQAEFLDRLAAIKAWKGEPDRVAVPVRRRRGPQHGTLQAGRMKNTRPRAPPGPKKAMRQPSPDGTPAARARGSARGRRNTRQKGVVRFGLHQGPESSTMLSNPSLSSSAVAGASQNLSVAMADPSQSANPSDAWPVPATPAGQSASTADCTPSQEPDSNFSSGEPVGNVSRQ